MILPIGQIRIGLNVNHNNTFQLNLSDLSWKSHPAQFPHGGLDRLCGGGIGDVFFSSTSCQNHSKWRDGRHQPDDVSSILFRGRAVVGLWPDDSCDTCDCSESADTGALRHDPLYKTEERLNPTALADADNPAWDLRSTGCLRKRIPEACNRASVCTSRSTSRAW